MTVHSVWARCGPFPPALAALKGDSRMRKLVNSMRAAVVPIGRGVEAIDKAKSKGTLKVVLTMEETEAAHHYCK